MKDAGKKYVYQAVDKVLIVDGLVIFKHNNLYFKADLKYITTDEHLLYYPKYYLSTRYRRSEGGVSFTYKNTWGYPSNYIESKNIHSLSHKEIIKYKSQLPETEINY